MLTVTSANVVDAVRALATESPDCVYTPPYDAEDCMYGAGYCSNGSFGCIVGQALVKLGFDGEQLDSYGIQGAGGLLEDIGVLYHSRINSWLNCVQACQDSGHKWVEAVNIADAHHPVAVDD